MDTQEIIQRGQELAIQFAPKIVAAIVIFIVGRIVAKLLSKAARGAVSKVGGDAILVNFLGNLVYMAVLAMVIVASLGQLGVKTTSFIAMLGAAGLAIGLALQGSLSNFAAGVLIVVLRPYRVGDFIEAAGVSGTVFEVQIFNTILTTPDNKRVIIPNGQIGSSIITNFSANENRRLDLIFGASYEDNVGDVKAILTDIVDSHEKILEEPAPRIVVAELADSSVNYGVYVWVHRSDLLATKFDITEQVKRRFDEAGITIPFPQIDSHVHTVNEKVA
ncbi:MAG: mechanosensitive ion channel domain-containing protein [Pseudomonadota bacterium]